MIKVTGMVKEIISQDAGWGQKLICLMLLINKEDKLDLQPSDMIDIEKVELEGKE